MASRIKGITVEIGGDTSGLEKSLAAVNNSIKKTQSQLRDVNNLLKLDPSNTILLAQKQELLQAAIGDTEKKLEALEQAQEDVAKAFERGDIGKDQYMAFQREVEETRGTLNRYRTDLSGLQSEQERLSSNTERLNKLFAATGSSVDDYADVLGSRLVTAIRNGTASSDQLKTAVEKIGKAVTGGKADIRQLTDALDTVDDGQSVRNLINDLNDVGDAAQGAADDIGEITQAAKGAALMEAADQLSVVGDKIQDVGDKAVSAYAETETAVSKVNAYFGETGEAAEASAEIVKNVYGSGVGQSMDAVAEAVIMVKKNLGELGDTDLTNLTKQALVPLGEKIVELANVVLPPLVAIITAVSEVFGMLPEPVQNFVIILGALLVAFTALTPVIAALAVSFGALNISLLPVIGIIAGVAAAIAGIIAIVKNWGAITEWFGNLWQVVSQKLMELWNGLVVFFTETIPAAFQIFIGFFSAIPDWWSGLWSQVSAFFTDIWNAILQNPIVQLVVTTLTSLWENAKNTLQGIWSGICQIASGAFELLKNVILAPVLLLIDLVTGNFSQLASDAANIWNNIRNAASQIWSGIRQVVTSAASGLKQGVETVLSALSQFASQIWSAMKQTASSVWNGIKTTVVNIASALREAAVSAFQRMVSGIGSALSGLYSVVSNGFSSAIRFITGLPGQAFQWGKDFIQGLINGISSMIQSVINTVSGLADRIRSFLHFSAPDEGPLADYETWMPDFMKGLASGIEKNRNLVEKAVRDVASDMVISPKVNGSEYGYAEGALSGGNMSDLISGISSAVSEALAGFSGPQGNIVIPVYVGGTLLDELVVTAQARQNLRSGGR